jgi:hypothetical protein
MVAAIAGSVVTICSISLIRGGAAVGKGKISSAAITFDRYSHVTEGMDREAVEAVATLIK